MPRKRKKSSPENSQPTPSKVCKVKKGSKMADNIANQNMSTPGYNTAPQFSIHQPQMPIPMSYNGSYLMMNPASPIFQSGQLPTTPLSQSPPGNDILASILQKLESMDKKLSQLDKIQTSVSKITVRIDKMEKKFNDVETKVKEMEKSCEFGGNMLDEFGKKQKELDSLLSKMSKFEQEHKARESDMKAEIVDLKSRSMRDNLMFYKIAEEKDEICENKVLDFIETRLKIADAKSDIKIHRAHRVGAYRADRVRPIVAKFAYFPDREKVRRASKELKGTHYGISEQFPKEVMDTRRKLMPILKQARDEGKDAYLVADKLFIDKKRYVA